MWLENIRVRGGLRERSEGKTERNESQGFFLEVSFFCVGVLLASLVVERSLLRHEDGGKAKPVDTKIQSFGEPA